MIEGEISLSRVGECSTAMDLVLCSDFFQHAKPVLILMCYWFRKHNVTYIDKVLEDEPGSSRVVGHTFMGHEPTHTWQIETTVSVYSVTRKFNFQIFMSPIEVLRLSFTHWSPLLVL